MIKYQSGSFGFQLLFRVHGSAVFKSVTPGVMSCGIYLILYHTLDLQDDTLQIMDHPYPMGALISALAFILAFRATFSYNRYWEAIGDVHSMHSKWLDVGMELAAFHLQSLVYEARQPPSFGSHPELKSVDIQRERLNEQSLEQLAAQLDCLPDLEQSFRSRMMRVFDRKEQGTKDPDVEDGKVVSIRLPPAVQSSLAAHKSINATTPKPSDQFTGKGVLRHLRGKFVKKSETAKHYKIGAVHTNNKPWDPKHPPLFLQEGAHLLSLLSAVAMSTLRNDLEQADSPLITFEQGQPLPHVDPDSYHADVRKDWAMSKHRTWTVVEYLLGISRTPKARTLYNAARPFRVIGGVSDGEIELLQAARGPLAKVALCTLWLQEFITREHLHGSMGNVGPPILSRLYQFLSDGMLGYNQARKIAYIPYPFPHAQVTSLFVLAMIGLMPVLMISFVSNQLFGCVMNLLTVMCFSGLHEVARELESPFSNAPNDIPLNNFQGQYNEALMNMMSGYHPDAYWEVKSEQERAIRGENSDDIEIVEARSSEEEERDQRKVD